MWKPSGSAFVGNAGHFQGTVLLGAKALPFVFKDEIARPLLLPLAGLGVPHADDLALTLEIEIDRPIVDPISPMLGEGLSIDDAILVLAYLHDLAALDYELAALVLESRFGVG